MTEGPTVEEDSLFLAIKKTDQGSVVMVLLKEGTNYVLLHPDQADEISATMAKYAHEARTGLQPHSKAEMMERLRTKLVTRLGVVIGGLQEKGKPPLFIANEVTDIILSEAL